VRVHPIFPRKLKQTGRWRSVDFMILGLSIIPTRSASEEFSHFRLAGASGWY
jgi:ABC-type transporter MlaC component